MVRQPVTINGVTRWKDVAEDAVSGVESPEAKGVVLRQEIGDVLRSIRQAEGRTLRDVSHGARVSLGYLSEVERGQKEASSELLASICVALDVPLSAMLGQVAERIALAEGVPDTVPTELQREFGQAVVPDGVPDELTQAEFARSS
ncbi:helix-turn-helix domain-containing protein [Nesterenkonia aerolata]|uniref:Helix-turn-helix transcriptional regulator n=1 Tax=Nesterenkonia aerolata TaxID=3074079 RepID=A0ABU2DNG0_9MICC|nr:helix-turn-helix transcriptional regulator [Nesterenkonia sp. LY-0111]MDR8017976.1 helix-turn-helix transcriptional regulator [Nesterenkonia sp. LY-0111]